MRHYIDSHIRAKVTPIAGSVVYCNLGFVVEHSGIYIDDGAISNIVVDGFAESEVRLSDAKDFTSNSTTIHSMIYVSCDKTGAVGHQSVARRAHDAVGQRSFYGLVVKNCHEFSRRCVDPAEESAPASAASQEFVEFGTWESTTIDPRRSATNISAPTEWRPWESRDIVEFGTWEPTMAALKYSARKILGATKWRLWDWQSESEENKGIPDEPDWKSLTEHFMNRPLNDQIIGDIRRELAATKAYEEEISDEDIPDAIRKHLAHHRQTMMAILEKYEAAQDFLAQCPGASFSYGDLIAMRDDFTALARLLQHNPQIKELARKMGRNYISEERKKHARIPQASKSEVHGTHRSDDLMRLLPSELLNLEDETLETLFFSRLLEKGLLTYELQGTTFKTGDETEISGKRTGPVIACLDTSGSMSGLPLLRGQATLLAIANMLKQEGRSLHVLLFGSNGELSEFSMTSAEESAGLLKFVQQGFGGGTDFETPLRRALSIIREHRHYQKADLLMLTDGAASLTPQFTTWLQGQKSSLDCSIYTVLCAAGQEVDDFSDEVMVL